MPIPKFNELLRPMLVLLQELGPTHIHELTERLAAQAKLTAADRAQRLPSGRQTVIRNRAGWSQTFLNKAGLIRPVRRGIWEITPAGATAIGRFPQGIAVEDLQSYPNFREWHAEGRDDATPLTTNEPAGPLDTNGGATPLESIQSNAAALRAGSGDQGVDGVIKADRLGLDHVYLQAKRWQGTVGRPEIQAFVGALQGKASKGVFITTSAFTAEAHRYAAGLNNPRVRLVDGPELATLMVEARLGVDVEQTIEIYQVDGDFFEET